MNYKDLGEFVKSERKKHDFTQADLAKLSDVTDRTIKNIEAGIKTHINTLRKVMKVLGYKVDMTTQIVFSIKKD
ncbi:MAG: helix-turn-helix domain-containing protein [Chitinophagales bacterium]